MFTVVLAPKATVPDRLLVPVVAVSVPPFKVRASAPTVTPCKSSVAPLATLTPPALVPSPVAWLMANVPSLTVVLPV